METSVCTAAKKLESCLKAVLPEDCVRMNEPMSAHTTFGVGGPADAFVEVGSIGQIHAALAACREAGAPVHVLGCGSNVLVADNGVRGAVLHLGESFNDVSVEGAIVRARAGATNAQVAAVALDACLTGYEFASGIPGSIGGAAVMNAGAYGGQFSDVASGIRCLTPEGDLVFVDAADAQWGYRHSMMMDKGYVVLDVELCLHPGKREEIASRMEELAAQRSEKQPLELGSAGSTFKRPEGHFAGALIDEAGLRGFRVGNAGVSDKHCGFVVNYGGATATEVLEVIRHVQERVFAHSGVRLEPEVRIWD